MAEPTAERKAAARAEYRRRRRSLTDADRRGRAARLWRAVVAELTIRGHLGPGRRLMAFHGFGDEPPTDGLFEAVWSAGTELVLPRMDDGRIVPIRHRRDGPLVAAPIGALEPTGPPLDPGSVDAILVPGVAFDRHGYRLGYGRGHYDRFLPTLPAACLLMGTCLHPQLADELPVAGHDVAVDLVVTDEEIVGPTG